MDARVKPAHDGQEEAGPPQVRDEPIKKINHRGTERMEQTVAPSPHDRPLCVSVPLWLSPFPRPTVAYFSPSICFFISDLSSPSGNCTITLVHSSRARRVSPICMAPMPAK